MYIPCQQGEDFSRHLQNQDLDKYSEDISPEQLEMQSYVGAYLQEDSLHN